MSVIVIGTGGHRALERIKKNWPKMTADERAQVGEIVRMMEEDADAICEKVEARS
jgi:hypothetical protein